MTYNDVPWLALAAVLTALGLVLSYMAYKRSGWRAGARGGALSLLPIAAYLTGALEMLWKIGAAIGQFGTGFVFSPVKWIGVGVTGLAFALFLAAGGRVRRRATRDAHRATRGDQKDAATAGDTKQIANRAGGTQTQSQSALEPARKKGATPAKGSRKSAFPDDDDDLKDIEAILRNRGI